MNRCRICFADEPHQSFWIREMMFGTRERFKYFLCAECGCLQIETIPNDLDRHYPETYYSLANDRTDPTRHFLFARRFLMRQRVRPALFRKGIRLARLLSGAERLPAAFYESHPQVLRDAQLSGFGANILDVGCGATARWLHNLSRLGFTRLWGVDPFVKTTRKDNGVQLVRSDLINFAKGREGIFELVAFHHSLEHIPDQAGVLAAAVRLLTPTGTCLVRIPSLPCGAWERYGTDWVELDAPRHLYIHSHNSIKFLAERAGLKLRTITFDTSSLEFFGSEQYRRDVPLTDPRSLWIDPESRLFSEDEKHRFEELALDANRTGTAGRAVFVFHKA